MSASSPRLRVMTQPLAEVELYRSTTLANQQLAARWAQCEVTGHETALSIRSARLAVGVRRPSHFYRPLHSSASVTRVTGDETTRGQWGAGCEAVAGTIIKPTHQSVCDLTACLLSCVLRSFWVEPSALFVSEGDANDALVLPAFISQHPPTTP